MRMVKSAKELAGEEIEILAYVDEDDPRKADYPEWVEIGPPKRSSKAVLYLINKVCTPYFQIGTDDIVFRTQDWVAKTLAHMPKDDFGLISPTGKETVKGIDGHFLCSMRWHTTIGIFPDEFTHFGPDGWALKVAVAAGRWFKVKDVLIDHYHFKYDPRLKDDTYMRNRTSTDNREAERFLIENAHRIQAAADRLKELIR